MISNLRPLSGRGTLSGGQFDWGGRLPKSNGGARRFPQPDWKPGVECIGIRELNCETDKSNRCESRLSDPVVPRGRAIAQRIKGTPGITGLSPPRVHIDGEVWHLDVGSSHPGAGAGPKGSAVRRLKWYASWVQNVVRQFGPIFCGRRKFERSCP